MAEQHAMPTAFKALVRSFGEGEHLSSEILKTKEENGLFDGLEP